MSKRYSNKGVNSAQNRQITNDPRDNGTRVTLLICVAALVLIAVAVTVALIANGFTVIPGKCDMDEVRAEINSMKVTDFTETEEKTDYVKITIKDYGDVVVRLREDIAPETVENFQDLVSDKFYDGLTIHRVLKGFMIQGGDPKGDGTGSSAQKIKGEFSKNNVRNDLFHIKGVISMARSNDMNSASCQFFICNADASGTLDGSYAGFGYVVAGLEVVDAVSDVKVSAKPNDTSSEPEVSWPVETITIEKIRFVTK